MIKITVLVPTPLAHGICKGLDVLKRMCMKTYFQSLVQTDENQKVQDWDCMEDVANRLDNFVGGGLSCM